MARPTQWAYICIYMAHWCGAGHDWGIYHALSPKTQVIKLFMRICFIADSYTTRRGASIAISTVLQRPTESNGHLWFGGGRGPGWTSYRPLYRRSALNTWGLGAPIPPTASTFSRRTITAVSRSVSTCLVGHENEPNMHMLQSWLGALAVD